MAREVITQDYLRRKLAELHERKETVEAHSARFSYKDAMWRHLADYKVLALGVAKNGIWIRNHREYPHILPFGFHRLNILQPYRDEFWSYYHQMKIRLHPDFHHLSSSQAMCFNLFFPFIAEGKKHLQVLRSVFATDGIMTDAGFEIVLDPTEGTNFDFWFRTAKGINLFEIKLTEPDFGRAKRDNSHVLKFSTVYSPSLAGKFSPDVCSCEIFLEHYQLMRNIWNLKIGNADTLVCVVARANGQLSKGIDFLGTCLSEEYRQRVRVRYLEDLVADIEQVIPSDASRMKEHFLLFRGKYLPDFTQTA
jgi:hypothetical protein